MTDLIDRVTSLHNLKLIAKDQRKKLKKIQAIVEHGLANIKTDNFVLKTMHGVLLPRSIESMLEEIIAICEE